MAKEKDIHCRCMMKPAEDECDYPECEKRFQELLRNQTKPDASHSKEKQPDGEFLNWLDEQIAAIKGRNDAPRGSHFKSMDTGALSSLQTIRNKYLECRHTTSPQPAGKMYREVKATDRLPDHFHELPIIICDGGPEMHSLGQRQYGQESFQDNVNLNYYPYDQIKWLEEIPQPSDVLPDLSYLASQQKNLDPDMQNVLNQTFARCVKKESTRLQPEDKVPASQDERSEKLIALCSGMPPVVALEIGIWIDDEIEQKTASLTKERDDYRAALIDIRDHGGGKLCREDRSRMGKIAFEVLQKYPKQ